MKNTACMSSAFDLSAPAYDTTFAETLVGKAQRKVVWLSAQPLLPAPPGRVLEINCGTGIDAEWLANQGHQVLATDMSTGMLEQTRRRNAGKENVRTGIWDVTKPIPEDIGKVDLIWSNFGGLNCLSPEQMRNSLAQLNTCLVPDGKVVLVLMGRVCWMERLYFLLKGNLRAMRRRNSMQHVRLDNHNTVDTYYYAPNSCKALCPPDWQQIALKPVGICIPPSYLNAFFVKHPFIFRCLVALDKLLSNLSWCAHASDHYVLIMQKQA